MTPSAIASAVATRYPRLSRIPVRVWAEWYARTNTKPHWLCRNLIATTNARVRKQFVLSTGDRLVADPFDHLAEGVKRDGCYEPAVVRLFERVIRRGMVALDIGANVGHHTVMLSRLVGPTGRVHAFEPDPRTFVDLRTNVQANRGANVQIINSALAAETGKAPLYRGTESMVSSLRPTVHSGIDATSVAVDTLDRWSATSQLSRIDFIKLDVEGAELAVLRGAEKTLRRWQPLLVTEVSIHGKGFGNDHMDVTAALRSQGYALFEVGPFPLRTFSDSAIGDRVFLNVLASPVWKVQELQNAGVLSAGARGTH